MKKLRNGLLFIYYALVWFILLAVAISLFAKSVLVAIAVMALVAYHSYTSFKSITKLLKQ